MVVAYGCGFSVLLLTIHVWSPGHQSHCPLVRPVSTGARYMEEGLSPGPGASPSGHLVYSLNLGFCYDQLTDLGKLPASLSCPSTVGTFSLGHGPHPAFPGRTLPASPCSGGPACLHLTQHALPLVHIRHCWFVCVVVVGVFFFAGEGLGG